MSGRHVAQVPVVGRRASETVGCRAANSVAVGRYATVVSAPGYPAAAVIIFRGHGTEAPVVRCHATDVVVGRHRATPVVWSSATTCACPSIANTTQHGRHCSETRPP